MCVSESLLINILFPDLKKKNVVEICLSQHSLCSGVLYSIEILIVDYTF